MKTATAITLCFGLVAATGRQDSSWIGTGVVPYDLQWRHPDGEPKMCDGTLYHLCCYRSEGDLNSDSMKGLRCLSHSEIEFTNNNNQALLQGGSCNHEHLCCSGIKKYRKNQNLEKGRLMGVEEATGCKLVWSYDDLVRKAMGFDKQAAKMKEYLRGPAPPSSMKVLAQEKETLDRKYGKETPKTQGNKSKPAQKVGEGKKPLPQEKNKGKKKGSRSA